MYKALKLDLTEKQILQALNGKTIRVRPDQINVGDSFISLHPENVKKVQKAFHSKKGFTLKLSHGELWDTAHRMNGSGFWSKVWSGLKKAWGALKDSGVLSAAADAAVAPLSSYTGQPQLVQTGRQLLKKTTGIGIKERMSKADKYAQMKAAGIFLS